MLIHGTTINDVWFKCLWAILQTDPITGQFINAYPTGVIQSGSFENEQSRLQFPFITIQIDYPHHDIIVKLPEGSTLPAPTSEEKATKYFHHYIIGQDLAENETYTYGQRINISLAKILETLEKTPISNQMVMEIADPHDSLICYGKDGKLDPPCLRLIDIKVRPRYKAGTLDRYNSFLDMHVYFRSWDLYAGMPENLAGLSMLQLMLAGIAGMGIGRMYCYSSGLHLYKYQKELAELRTHLKGSDF